MTRLSAKATTGSAGEVVASPLALLRTGGARKVDGATGPLNQGTRRNSCYWSVFGLGQVQRCLIEQLLA